jgi:hypothetical protein
MQSSLKSFDYRFFFKKKGLYCADSLNKNIQKYVQLFLTPTELQGYVGRNYEQIYEGGSKSFRPDIHKTRQMENAARDI